MVDRTGRVLFVLTSHDALGDTGRPTGYHMEELTAPYWRFVDAGFTAEIASIAGGDAPMDPSSLADEPTDRPGSVQRFLDDDTARGKLSGTPAVDAVDPDGFDAVYLPGGHGTMWDFPDSAGLGRLLRHCHARGAPVGAVCHGPAGLLAACEEDSCPLIAGRRLNAFTDAEEERVGLARVVPFLLESRLKELGARFEKSSPFRACVVSDGPLVTGQNPRSARAVADKMLEIMGLHSTADAA
ncbi:Putative intracellular protease/amidase [Limimonas halophila]|uniref:Putative intracellular protease/amidase n=1 Tax=Limimonas halophila TaxID=1082479 RepID=A0A1G7LPS7_9PROT|nr:type 1 glutamine amidotransferase domain-containing protein [Limimonas halophila]SDF51495.1 Putative intracellular protease/amidase [Limimonas halophila]